MAQACATIGFASVIPFMPFYVRELGVTDERAVLLWSGWGTFTSAGLAMAIMAPIWGTLADRHGRKVMVMRSMFGGMVVLFLMGFAQNVYQLVALRVIQGALAGTVSASTALVSSIVPERRTGFALGLMQAAYFTAHSLGPWIGGAAAEAFGHRIPFFFSAGFLLTGGLLTLFLVHENYTPPVRDKSSKRSGTIWEVLALSGFGIMVGMLMMVYFSNTFVGPIMPLYVEQISGLEQGPASALTGRILGMAGIAAALSAAILGRLSDRVGHQKLLVVCTALTGLALIPHAFAANTNQLMVLRMCAAFAGAGTLPAANSLIRRIIPQNACGRAFGLVSSTNCIGVALGPAAGTSLAAAMGLRVPFMVVGIIFLGIALYALLAVPRALKKATTVQVAGGVVAGSPQEGECDTAQNNVSHPPTRENDEK